VADNRVAEAIDVVARWHLSGCTDDRLGRDEFPGILNADWVSIINRAAAIADSPSNVEYEAAYDFLTARAGDDA